MDAMTRRRAVVALAGLVVLSVPAGCGFRTADEPPPTVALRAEYAAYLAGGLDTFRRLSTGTATTVDPATARLVGPTYGIAFDELGTATRFDGMVFNLARTGLHPDDIGRRHRGEHRAAEGHEVLLAHVPDVMARIPRPERGDGQSFRSWHVEVGGAVRELAGPYDRGELRVGSIVAVSVPVGADARLVASADGRTTGLSLRTGRPT
jgi:hypothetical protein